MRSSVVVSSKLWIISVITILKRFVYSSLCDRGVSVWVKTAYPAMGRVSLPGLYFSMEERSGFAT